MSKLILISGEEEFLMERMARDEAASSLFSEVLEFRAPDGLDSYLEESRAPLFESNPRAFIIWDCKKLPELPEGSEDLLIAVSPPGKTVLQDARATRVLNIAKLKSYNDRNEYVGWVLKEGQRFNIDLSRIAGALFVNVGDRLRKLASEVNKIVAVSVPGSVVSPDVVRSILCFSAEITPKEIIEAINGGHTSAAISYYDRLQENGDETGWIIAYMHRHVLQILRLKILSESKIDEGTMANITDVHPFVLRKNLLPLVNRWTKESLVSSSVNLAELDEAHKRGSGAVKYFLELEITRLSEEARNVNV